LSTHGGARDFQRLRSICLFSLVTKMALTAQVRGQTDRQTVLKRERPHRLDDFLSFLCGFLKQSAKQQRSKGGISNSFGVRFFRRVLKFLVWFLKAKCEAAKEAFQTLFSELH
jgi:hypothetical protein